jgi:carboxylesterase
VAVLAGAEPFRHSGGPVGVLLCHGFTGSPQSLRPWADRLAEAGYSVELPLLPGHGTTWEEMNRTRWQQWYACVDGAFAELAARTSTVVVAGLSMGGALALRLAEQHGAAVAGVVLVNPAVRVDDPRMKMLPVLRWLVPSLPGIGSDIKAPGATELAYSRTPLQALHSMVGLYADVTGNLARVTQPLLLLRSTEDHVVPASSSALILSRVASTDATEVLLEDSYHVATLDNDADKVFSTSAAFIARVTRAAEGASGSATGGAR